MKPVTTCPKCESDSIGDMWCIGRMLQYVCHECHWKDTPRIPTKKRITNTKELFIDGWSGWDYISYDKYGHVMKFSQTFGNREKAIKEIEKELEKSSNDTVAGPYTIVLFNTPSKIKIKGKVFKSK